MELLVLGSGTCLGPAPGTAPRAPPLFALAIARPGGAPLVLLLDCSEGARFRLAAAGIDPARVAHVAVSHPHADHAALPPFLQARACEVIYGPPGRDLGLHLYLPPASAEALPSLLAWHQPEDNGRPSSKYPLDVVPTPDGFRREIAPGVVLSAFSVHHGHGRSPAVAFRVESGGLVFAYSGDTGICEGIGRAAVGADLFVCEAATRVGDDMARTYGHLNPRQAAEVAREAGVRALLLTHYTGLDAPAAMLDDARAGGFRGALDLARDGELWQVAAR